MFYICKKREDGNFGVMDSQDGVVEYYTPQEIIKFVTKLHIEIHGVCKKENGKFGIKVLKPTSFETISEDSLESDGKVAQSDTIIHGSEFYKASYEELSEYEITKLAEDTALKLATVIRELTTNCYHGESLELLDGLDCVGYDNVKVYDTGYEMCIYFNPDVEYNRIYSKGFGFDLHKDGKLVEDSHFDSTFDKWEKDFESYKFKDLFYK